MRNEAPKGKIAIFGTGRLAVFCAIECKRLDCTITAFIDYDDKTLPNELNGVPVFHASDYPNWEKNDNSIVIAKEAMFASRAIFTCYKYHPKTVFILDDIAFVFRRDEDSALLFNPFKPIRWEGKATISYLETHVVDQCNLKCQGCSHFSNIARASSIDPNTFFARLVELSSKFNVVQLRLLGGEPLLHPKLEEILLLSRKALPDTSLVLATNGTLLSSKISDQHFETALKKCSVFVYITEYPPMKKKIPTIEEYLTKIGVSYKVKHSSQDDLPKKFESRLMIQPHDNRSEAINCSGRFCRFFKDGLLSKCPFPLLIGVLNSEFDTSYETSAEDFVKIESINDSWEALSKLQNPIPFCRYCSENPRSFDWTNKGSPKLVDYLA